MDNITIIAVASIVTAGFKIDGAKAGLRVSARNVEDVVRLAKSRCARLQLAHQRLACRDGGAEMLRTRSKIGVMQVIGFDPHLHQRP